MNLIHNVSFSKLFAMIAIVSACLFAHTVKADEPPAPTVTVLAYFDGTASLSELYDTTLLGFAQNPNYLPVEETADWAAFEEALVNGDYHVFVAVTSDSVLAEDWANAVPPDTNFAAFYPSDDPDYEVTTKLVFNRIINEQPPTDLASFVTGDDGADGVSSIGSVDGKGIDGDHDIVILELEGGELLGEQLLNGSAASSNAGGIGQWIKDGISDGFEAVAEKVVPYLDRFAIWLEQTRIKAQQEAARLLRRIAVAIRSLPNPEDIEVDVELTVGVENALPVVKLRITMHARGANVPALCESLGDMIDPNQPPAAPPAP